MKVYEKDYSTVNVNNHFIYVYRVTDVNDDPNVNQIIPVFPF